MKRLTRARPLMAMGVVFLTACSGDAGADGASEDAGVVNVYSHRHYDTDQELFRRFTESTGIRVNVQTASADELITRLETEGADTEADVLVTVDAGRLQRAKAAGLLASVSSETLDISSAVPIPTILPLMALALAGLGFQRRKAA